MAITTLRLTSTGDIHNNLVNLDKIKEFILQMKSQEKIDFAGFVGDYVSSSADVNQLNNVKARFDSLGIRYYAATGNHDASGSNCYNNCSGTSPTHASDCAFKTSFGYFPDQYPPTTDFTKDGITFQILVPGMCWTGGAFWKYDFSDPNISKTKPTIVFNHGPVLKPATATCGAWDSLHEYAFSMKSQLDQLNMLSIYSGHIHAASTQPANTDHVPDGTRLYVIQDAIGSSRCTGDADKHRNIGYTKITYDSSTNKYTTQYQNMEYMNAGGVVNTFVDPFPDIGPQILTSIEILPESSSIKINETIQISAICKDQNNNTMTCPSLTWISSNSTIATVNASGLVTGIATGTANITARSNSIISNISVITVTAPPVLSSIEILPESASLNINETIQLSVTCKDQNGNTMTCPSLTWNSSDVTKATVSNGLVTGISTGTANITARSNSIMSNLSVISIVSPVLKTIIISPSSASLNINATVQLSATCKDQNNNTMTCPSLTWNSSDATKANVSNGLVTAIATGTANITAISDSIISNISKITVVQIPILKSIVISPASASININGTIQLSAICKDQNGNTISCPTITWHTSDTTKVTINPTTGTTTTAKGISTGIANITATSDSVTSNTSVITVQSSQGSITVTNPSAGDKYKVGEPRVIRWQSTGKVGSHVKIELLKSNNVVKIITSSTDNDGKKSWTIPKVQTGIDYQVKITSTSTNISGISNKFTIIGTTPLKFKCTGAPDYNCILDPTGAFNSLEECQNVCKSPTKFKCSGAPDYKCVLDPTGTFNSLEECQKACKPPIIHNLGVFYYPWFGCNSDISPQNTWRHWKNGGHNPPKTWASNYLPDYKPGSTLTFDPNNGLYSSKDINLIKWQLGLMKNASIEFVISSWWGQNSYEDQALSVIFNTVLSTTDNPYPDIKFCIYYEKEGTTDVPQSEIIDDINYIKQKYASDPHYFKINGKPVIFVYNTIGNGASIAAKWNNVRNATGIYTVLKVFGGYNNVAGYADGWHQYAPTLPFEQQYSYSALVSPGYHKYHEQPRLTREDFVRFENNIKSLAAANVQFRLIETWNEWEESTGIEPAQKINHDDINGFTPAADSYGTKYIDIIRSVFATN